VGKSQGDYESAIPEREKPLLEMSYSHHVHKKLLCAGKGSMKKLS
jgi:hypothetical protein